MLKSISFIVLTQFFQFNELKILRQQVTSFFKLNQQNLFTVYLIILLSIYIYSNINQIYLRIFCQYKSSACKFKCISESI